VIRREKDFTVKLSLKLIDIVQRWSLVFAVLLLGMSIGCKVGPDYARPGAPVSSAWFNGNERIIVGASSTPECWWQVFQDAELDRLVQTSYKQNLTVKVAAHRVQQARALRGVAKGNFFPQVQSLNGSYSHQWRSSNAGLFGGGIPGFSFQYDDWSTGIESSWELDFWGRFRRGITEADANIGVACANYDDAIVILVSDVASSYVELRTLQNRIQLAEENAKLQAETVRLADLKLQVGTVDLLDVEQARTNLYQTQSLIPDLKAQAQAASNRLCILLGQPPYDIAGELGNSGIIPTAPPQATIGIPNDLLRQRPDVRVAERSLAAQSERIGIAKSDFYPHISLIGNVGVNAADFSNLFRQDSISAVAGPSFRWNLLNYRRIQNKMIYEEERFYELCHLYQQSVLNAQREVEDALAGFTRSHEQVETLNLSVTSAKKAAEVVLAKYSGGEVDLNRVVVVQTSQVVQQERMAIARGAVAQNLIKLYRSLGGGWELRAGITHSEIVTDVPLNAATDASPKNDDSKNDAANDQPALRKEVDAPEAK
jgi:NodT family efflux transporter outer membrane factor (OMF) lipoprotein